MITFTLNGHSVDPDDIGDTLLLAATEQIKERLHKQLSAVRNPETGEFPTVVVTGNTIENISARVEGSPGLLSLVRGRLDPEDLPRMNFVEVRPIGPPKAFLSFAWEDRGLAKQVAESLQANGIDTWWAEWEIRAGDSLRQRIDEGLRNCTVFLVLLTPHSIQKPWVNQEMDAGLIRRIENQARFIALRSNLPPTDLPPLLRGILSPGLENFDSDIRQLISDIHGVARKPPLGPAPAITNSPDSGYSPAATAIAGVFIELTQHGTHGDPLLTVGELCERTSLSEEDAEDALFELGDLLEGSHGSVYPNPELFTTFDKHFRPWNPEVDALTIAVELVNDPSFPREPQQISQRYGWEPRRLNSAITYLRQRKLIEALTHMGMDCWVAVHIEKTDATRRFVKSRV